MSRARRLFGLARFLDTATGRTLVEIVAEFRVSERTVFRDVAALEEQGLLVEHLEGGRYRLDAGAARATGTSLDSTDLALVHVALGEAGADGEGPLARRLARVLEKVESALRGRPGALVDGVAEERDRRELARLVSERRSATFRYRSLAGTQSVHRVDPWLLFERAGAWYLAARCRRRDEPRLYRLQRLRGVRAGEERFEPPAEIDVARLRADAWLRVEATRAADGDATDEPRPVPGVDVALRLSAELAARLPPIAKLTDERRTRRADGAVELRARARDLEQAARLALELGDAVVPLEPRELRVRVRRLASEAARKA